MGGEAAFIWHRPRSGRSTLARMVVRFSERTDSSAVRFRSLSAARGLAIKGLRDLCHIGDVIESPRRGKQETDIDIARFEPIASACGCVEQYPTLRGLDEIAIGLENAATEGFVSQHAEL